jgi:hypothetical protein
MRHRELARWLGGGLALVAAALLVAAGFALSLLAASRGLPRAVVAGAIAPALAVPIALGLVRAHRVWRGLAELGACVAAAVALALAADRAVALWRDRAPGPNRS